MQKENDTEFQALVDFAFKKKNTFEDIVTLYPQSNHVQYCLQPVRACDVC